MMRKRPVLIILQSLVLSSGIFAQQVFHSLEEVWTYANTHNIQILSATANKKIADRSLSQSYGNLFPLIDASGNYTDNMNIPPTLVPDELFGGKPGTYKEVKFGMNYLYNGLLSVQLNMVNPQDWFNIKSAKYNDEIAALSISKTKRDLYEQIANSYCSFLLLREMLKLSNDNAKTADSIYEMATRKFELGFINEIALNNARINKEKAEKTMAESNQNLTIVLNNFKILLDFSLKDSLVITDAMDDLSGPPQGSIIFAADPDVGLSFLQVRLANNNLRLAKANLAPTLSAVYQYNAQFSTNTFLDFSGRFSLPQQYLGLRLNFPLFTGGSRIYQIRKMRVDLDIKLKVSESTLRQSEISNQNILLEYHKTQSSLLKAKEILALFKANDDHASRQFTDGFISLDDRLIVYTDYVNNQNDYFQSLSDFLVQYYRVKIRQKDF